MRLPSAQIIFLISVLLLLLFGWIHSVEKRREEQFLSKLIAIFFAGFLLILGGLILIRNFPAWFGLDAVSASSEWVGGLFQALTLISWILVGILFSKAFNPAMSAALRVILGFAVSFFVTTIAGNFLYELVTF